MSQGTAKASSTKRQSQERRNELLLAAVRAIRRLGAQATMSEIAIEARCSKPVFYDYFGDKRGLSIAITDKMLGDLENVFEVLLDSSKDTRETVRSAIDVFVSFAAKEPELYRFLVQGTLNPGTVNTLPPMLPSIAVVVVKYLERELTKSGHDVEPAETIAVAILGMVFSTTEWWLVVRGYLPDNYVEHLTDLVCGGLYGCGIQSTALGSI